MWLMVNMVTLNVRLTAQMLSETINENNMQKIVPLKSYTALIIMLKYEKFANGFIFILARNSFS